MAEVSGAAQAVDQVKDWLPRERTLPIGVELGNGRVRLVVKELSIVQRDVAVGLVLDGIQTAAHALATVPGGETALDGARQILAALTSGDGAAIGELAGAVRELLAGKIGELTCAVLANKPNARALGLLAEGRAMDEQTTRAVVELLRGELPASAEPVVLQAWWEVEDVLGTLGNWRALWTATAGTLVRSETP